MSSRLRSLNSTRISFFAFQDIITSVSGILILVTLILATELDRPIQPSAYDADAELERHLSELLRQQAAVEVQNGNLQELLAAAETAPAAEKLEADIARLRAQLAEEKKKQAVVAEQLAASQAALEARDRALGLTGLKAQIQGTIQETEVLARKEADVRREMAALEKKIGGVQSRLLQLRQWEGKLWLVPDMSSTSKEPLLAVLSGNGVKVQRFDHPEQTREFSKSGARAGLDSYLREAKPLDQYIVFFIRPSGVELFNRLVRLARDRGFEVGFDALEEDKDVYYSRPPVIDETTPPLPAVPSEYRAGSGGYSDRRGGSGNVGGNAAGTAGDPRRGGRPAGTQNDLGRAGYRTPSATQDGSRPGKGPDASAQSAGPPREGATGGQPGSGTEKGGAAASAKPKSWWQRLLEWIAGSSREGAAGGRPGSGSGAAASNGQGKTSPSDRGTKRDEAAASARGGAGYTAPGASRDGTPAGSSAAGSAQPAGTSREGAAGGQPGGGPAAGVGSGKGNKPPDSRGIGQGDSPKRAQATASAEPKKSSPAPTGKPAPPPAPKPKNWWQRLLEWVGLE